MKTLKCLLLFTCLAFPWMGNFVQAKENGAMISLPDADRSAIEQYLGPTVVGEAIPAPEVADTGLYLAARAGTRNFLMVSGDDAGKTEQHQVTQLKKDAGTTIWRYDAGGKFVYFVTAQSNGDYLVTGVEDIAGGAITKYSPPEPFMLQGLKPGEERNAKLTVKVFDLESPDDLTHEGELDVNYRYVGAYKVNVPAGDFDAILVKWTFKGKVGPASVDDTQYRFFAPDLGIVAAVEQLDVSAMLVYNRHTKVARVLASKHK